MAIYAVYNRTITDSAGNVVPGAHIEVRREVPGQPLASLFEDRDGMTGLGNPFDADANGDISFFAAGGAYKIRAYTGPSGAPTSEKIWRYEAVGRNAEADEAGTRTKRTVTAPGDVTIAADDADDIFIEKSVGEPTNVYLPPSIGQAKSKRIYDGKYDGNTNNIKVYPDSGEKVYGVTDGYALIDGNGGMVELTPRADGTGWQ